jgi:hypothetical protein
MNLAPHDDDTLSQAAPPMPAVAPAARNARRLMPKRFDLPSTRVQSDGKSVLLSAARAVQRPAVHTSLRSKCLRGIDP